MAPGPLMMGSISACAEETQGPLSYGHVTRVDLRVRGGDLPAIAG